MMRMTFKCYYCKEIFGLDKDEVRRIENVAKIKCPHCNDIEHIDMFKK